jgi:hypothetical protein
MDALLLGQPTASGSTVVTPLRKHSGAVHFGFLQFKCPCDGAFANNDRCFILFASIINCPTSLPTDICPTHCFKIKHGRLCSVMPHS